ncbi:MAG: hypothetical protein KKA99_00465 [Gammaproteobacteria bacterium]|nr:hypothetical protein [Gammaproteobacteria bacterium]MBU1629144.1 hypothetical protein [Gammaproteobacteria bacterium]MBU1927065.1 hypothetical protein [Gammaproteobacteria bacterium]MBU2546408.1 hypothetical protein [Gammaproteobacteria bacterium]
MGFVRKHLSLDGLLGSVCQNLRKEGLKEYEKSKISWQDCVMSGLAIFSLKFPSLLQFEEQKTNKLINRNLKTVYCVIRMPSDTCLRERLDRLSPSTLRRSFRTIFAFLQRGKVLEGQRTIVSAMPRKGCSRIFEENPRT